MSVDPMKHAEIYDGSPVRHVGFRWVFDESCRGLRSDMSVSEGCPIRHVSLRCVSDYNNIFVNSLRILKYLRKPNTYSFKEITLFTSKYRGYPLTSRELKCLFSQHLISNSNSTLWIPFKFETNKFCFIHE